MRIYESNISQFDVSTKNENQIELRDDERQKCEVWTRVMGYHRPVSSFNIGKKGEYYERKQFSLPKGSCK